MARGVVDFQQQRTDKLRGVRQGHRFAFARRAAFREEM
jgi:hypothetical protein